LLVTDPETSRDAVSAAGGELVELDQLVSISDFVSLHLPLTDQTRDLVDRRRLALFKQTAVLINVSRGGLVDEEALADALRTESVGAAAIDTTLREPISVDDPLLDAPNLLLSPHVAWLSDGAKADLQLLAARQLAHLLEP
jgi:phosphoglycerate dehydrogenase-like enzyme